MKSLPTYLQVTLAMMLALSWAPAHSQTSYWISEQSGNDLSTGSQTSPWRTLDHTVLASVPSNTDIHLERGGTYPGTITITYGSHDVSVTAYGSGELPVILGSDEVTWDPVPYSGQIWHASVPAGHTITYLFQNGALQTLARYPNVDAPDNGWLRNEDYVVHGQGTGTAEDPYLDLITSTTPLPALDWVGATAVIRTSNWSYHKPVVVATVGNTLSIPPTGYDLAQYAWGYYLQNSLDLLDQAGEWFYAPNTNNQLEGDLYFWADGPTPPTNVRMAFRSKGVDIDENCSNIDISDIAFRHQTGYGISASAGIAIHVDGCTFEDLYVGISDDGNGGATNDGHHYENNLFDHAYDAALRSSADHVVIENNTFHDIATVVGLGESGWGYQGARSYGNDVSIHGNSFVNVGYTALELNGSGEVYNNYISNGLAILNDGGGITIDMCDGLLIRDNIINGLGDPAVNLISSASDFSAYEQISFGIYFGDRSIKNTTIQRNTVSGCGAGIHVDHSLESDHITVEYNTLFNNDRQLSISDFSNYRQWTVDGQTYGGNGDPGNQGSGVPPNYKASYNDVYEGNIMYCLNENQRCMQQTHVWPGTYAQLVDFGTFTANHYFNPFNELVIWLDTKLPSAESGNPLATLPRTLERWQADHPDYDVASNQSPLRVSRFQTTPTNPPHELVEEHDFEDGVDNWNWSAGTCGNLQVGSLNSSPALQSSGCNWISEDSATSTVDDGMYLLSCDIKGSLPGAIKVSSFWTYDHNPPGTWIPFGTDPRHISVLVDGNSALYDQVSESDGHAQLHDIETQEGIQNATITLDNIYLTKVDVTYQDDQVAQDHILRYNNPLGDASDPQNAASFDLIGCWSDVNGQVWSGTVTLDPWESIVLYRLQTDYAIDPPNGTYDVTADETWDQDMNVRGSVVVESGATLTIDGATIGFADSQQEGVTTNIVVEPGGTLEVINGATLTSVPVCGANSMWNGIKVLATQAGPGAFGQVHIQSGGTISNALTGILAGDGDPADPGFSATAKGGEVTTWGAHFENNVHDVVIQGMPDFAQFLVHWDEPSFINTDFKTTAPLHYSGLDPVTHVRVAAPHQVFFGGCTFKNELPTHVTSSGMGMGIESLNSNINVQSCTFNNLDHGIHSMASGGGPYTYVDQCAFNDNICGIYLDGVDGFAVRGNDFSMGQWENVALTGMQDEQFNLHHRGIFSTGSYGFSIQDNDLMRSPGNTTPLEGIVVGYTQDRNEVVYRNTAEDLDVGYVGEGVCADVDNDPYLIGLQFQCNGNTDNATNIKSRIAAGDDQFSYRHTIRGRQGTDQHTAGNSFDGDLHFEVATQCPYTPEIDYYSLPVDAPATYTHEDPGNPDANYLVPVSITSTESCGTVGPVWLPLGHTFTEVSSELRSRRLTYGNSRYLLDQAIDGGHTDDVVQEIIDTWPEDIWDLRTELLTNSPYLSIEALKQLVDKPEVPDAIKAEICIANPDATKKEDFLKWAEYDAQYPLPGYIIDEIKASWDTRTYRTTMEETVADDHVALTQAGNYALELLQTDTVPAAPDSLQWVWQQVRNPAARYAEAALLMGQGRFAEADSVITAMPEEKDLKPEELDERGRMLTYIDVLSIAAHDGRNAYQLNTMEVGQLDVMIGENYDRPSKWASNLLCAVYNKCRAPYTGDDKVQKSMSQARPHDSERPAPSTYSIQPNPARGWAAFNYDRKEAVPEDGRIIVRTIVGKVMATLPMQGAQGQQVWDTRSVSPGVYMVEFRNAKQVLHTEKLIVQQ